MGGPYLKSNKWLSLKLGLGTNTCMSDLAYRKFESGLDYMRTL